MKTERVQMHDITELKTPEKEHERIQIIGREGDILNDLTVDALRERVNMIGIWHWQVRCLLKSLKSKHFSRETDDSLRMCRFLPHSLVVLCRLHLVQAS